MSLIPYDVQSAITSILQQPNSDEVKKEALKALVALLKESKADNA